MSKNLRKLRHSFVNKKTVYMIKNNIRKKTRLIFENKITFIKCYLFNEGNLKLRYTINNRNKNDNIKSLYTVLKT